MALRAMLQARYGAFLGRGQPVLSIRLREHGPTFDALDTMDPFEVEETGVEVSPGVEVSVEGSRISLRGAGFQAAFDRASGRGEITQTARRAALAPIDVLLRIVYAARLVEQDAFFLHAAAVERPRARDDGAVAFVGPSGSGKTALARLANGRALADELIVVGADGGAGWQACGTPYWGGRNISTTLRAIFLISPERRAGEAEPPATARRLSPKAALRAVLPHVVFSLPEPRFTRRLFGVIGRLAETVPCFALTFRPDPTLWSTVDAAVP